jgi:hypothetical protein
VLLRNTSPSIKSSAIMVSPFSEAELNYLQENADASRVSDIHWFYSVPIAAATISTALRLWAKLYGKNGVTLDDYLILIATICLIGECISGLVYGSPYGMGRHVNVVSAYDQMMVRRGDYVFSHFYDFALVFVKLGILAFYWRVFVQPFFRSMVLAVAAFVTAWGIGITVTLLVACRPIAAYWDVKIHGECLNLVTFTYFTNISNLCTDVIIFLMPVPMIWNLQLPTRRKLLLMFIFCIGLGTCIISAIRLTIIFGRKNPDFTWYYVSLGAFSAFEPLGALLCTNVPIILHMVRKKLVARRRKAEQKRSHQKSRSVSTIGSKGSRLINGVLDLNTNGEDQTVDADRTMSGAHSRQASDEVNLRGCEDLGDQGTNTRIWADVEKAGSRDTDGPSGDAQFARRTTEWDITRHE